MILRNEQNFKNRDSQKRSDFIIKIEIHTKFFNRSENTAKFSRNFQHFQ